MGQRTAREQLSITLEAAKGAASPDHILFSGLPGLGKTSLAQIVARELGSTLHSTTGPALERARDLAGILSQLKDGDCLFIDEIHRIPAAVEEYLYPAMEDFCVDIVIDQGPNSRTVRLRLARFTLLGATTREGLLSSPSAAGSASRSASSPIRPRTWSRSSTAPRIYLGSRSRATRRSRSPGAPAGRRASRTAI